MRLNGDKQKIGTQMGENRINKYDSDLYSGSQYLEVLLYNAHALSLALILQPLQRFYLDCSD